MTVNTLPDDTQFFDWFRLQVPDRKLTQLNVDGAKELLEHTPPDRLMAVLISMDLASYPVLLTPHKNPPKATRNEIISAAKRINVDPAAIKALNDVESPKGGFYADGTPVILFERHKFYDALTERHWFTKRDEMVEKYPDICNKSSGEYNVRPQYEKLEIAATLNWDAAHEAASWGFGQVMGFNWKKLGYESVRDFIEHMYKSEGAQLDAVCRYIKATGLDAALRKHDWAAFAKDYNGADYKRNDYDNKMSTAYAKAKREGW